MTVLFPGTKRAKSLNFLLTAHEDYINAFFDQIDETFGSIGDYIRNALGFDDGMIAEMKRKYLI